MSARSSRWQWIAAPSALAPPRWSGWALPTITRVAPPSASAAARTCGPSCRVAASKTATPSSSRIRKTLISAGGRRSRARCRPPPVRRAALACRHARCLPRPRTPVCQAAALCVAILHAVGDAKPRHADRRGPRPAGIARRSGPVAGAARRPRRPAGVLVRRSAADGPADPPCPPDGRVGRPALPLAAPADRRMDAHDAGPRDARRRDLRAQPHAQVQPALDGPLSQRGASLHAPLSQRARVQPLERAEHRHRPENSNPRRIATYYRTLRRLCPNCRVLGADVVDNSMLGSWMRAYLAAFPRGSRPRLWGLHNYVDVNSTSRWGTRTMLRLAPGEIWFTETGAVIARQKPSGGRPRPPQAHPHGLRARRRRDQARVHARAHEPADHPRLHLPLARGSGSSWDSALLSEAGTPRASFDVFAREARRAAGRR